MDPTAPLNPAGAPIPESIGDGTESARSRSVPGAELPAITAREGQVALTEQALRNHAGSDLNPITGYPQTTIVTSRTPRSFPPLPTVTGYSPSLVPSHNPPPMVSQVYQHQQNLDVSVDASLLGEAANARHTEVVQRIQSQDERYGT